MVVVSMSCSRKPMTYAQAGVNIDAKSQAIEALVKQLTFRRSGKVKMIDLPGQFTGLIDFGDVALTLCTDGVGTKLLIAKALDKWDTVGIDCVAMASLTASTASFITSFTGQGAYSKRSSSRAGGSVGSAPSRAMSFMNVSSWVMGESRRECSCPSARADVTGSGGGSSNRGERSLAARRRFWRRFWR